MPTNQKTTCPRIEWWRNTSGKYNYRLISRNGRTLYATVQGFERKDFNKAETGMMNSIASVANCYLGRLVKLPIVEVKAPK